MAEGWQESTRGMAFADYFNQYNQQNSSRGSKTLYMAFDSIPDVMRQDVPLPEMLHCFSITSRLENLVMWLNAGQQQSRLHYDGGDFLLTQISGKKHFMLISPKESHLLYTDFPRTRTTIGMAGFKSSEVDLHTFPRVADLTIFEATIEAGDVIFIPAMWWHLVSSLPAIGSEEYSRNLAVTLQFDVGQQFKQKNLLLSYDVASYITEKQQKATRYAKKFRCSEDVSPGMAAIFDGTNLRDVVLWSADANILSSSREAIRKDPLLFLKQRLEGAKKIEVWSKLHRDGYFRWPFSTYILSVASSAPRLKGLFRESAVILNMIDFSATIIRNQDLRLPPALADDRTLEVVFKRRQQIARLLLELQLDIAETKMRFVASSSVVRFKGRTFTRPYKQDKEKVIRNKVKRRGQALYELSRLVVHLERTGAKSGRILH
eukprot:CAMPEP_0185280028 /NCGR_PEP_ID=MMETSP1359-20130426/65049_1 /TAXON_ID=552665 /ORGANISM="Bigelowiella longifila, Strain CCMP242" /LENGTH=431 /DNA_ID=CAMNT_0027875107 /DNA_START=86 /DNA_END=1381 /DNA_ORIENTATION=-